jgi:preprotein translocase subunit SecG
MLAVLLTIHIIACVVLVVAVMLQRSEGGALGMGGGGTGGLISGRGAASVLVRVTGGLALLFFATSIIMTRINNEASKAPSVLEQQSTTPVDPFAPAPVTTTPSTTAPATTTVPAAPAPAPAIDPLAPKTNPAPATNSTTPATTPPASTPAPATTTPTSPAPAPQNGGSNN